MSALAEELAAAFAKAARLRDEITAKQAELTLTHRRIRSLERQAIRDANPKKVLKPRKTERVLQHMIETGRTRFTARHLMRDIGYSSTATLSALLSLTRHGKIVRLQLGVYAPVREAEAAE